MAHMKGGSRFYYLVEILEMEFSKTLGKEEESVKELLKVIHRFEWAGKKCEELLEFGGVECSLLYGEVLALEFVSIEALTAEEVASAAEKVVVSGYDGH